MFQARYAILLDGGFVTKKLQEKLKEPAKADDILALCAEIRAREELQHYELLRTYFYDAPLLSKLCDSRFQEDRSTLQTLIEPSTPKAYTIS